MKKEYIVLALIIIALSAYLVMHKTDSTHYVLPVLQDLGDSDIDQIDITHGDTTLTLKMDGSSWVVGDDNFPANEETVKTMVDSIKALSLTALVSESKSYTRYELDDQNKITITAKKDGKVLRTFDVGKVAGSYKHTFVKLEKDPKVYHADGNLRRNFEKNENDLSDKVIMKVDRAKVYGIQAKDGDVSLAVERKEEPVQVDVTEDEKKTDAPPAPPQSKDVWKDAAGAEKAKDKINNFISQFTNLRCEGYIKGKTKEDFTDPLIEVTLNAEKPYTLSVYPKPDDEAKEYPAVSSERALPFSLPASKVDDIKKKLGEI